MELVINIFKIYLIQGEITMIEQTKGQKSRSFEHIIRTKSGELKKVKLTRTKAIKIHCTECCGYEYHPKECEIKLCPLWLFRGKSWAGLSDSA
jgi:hypothetical protein